MTTLIPITRTHRLESTALRRVNGTLSQVFPAGLRLDRLSGRFGSLAWIILNDLGVGCLVGFAVAGVLRLVRCDLR